jgi:Domain of Unknown Function (DUF1206)
MATVRTATGLGAQRLVNEVIRGGWVQRCARVGYAAKGAVYAIIGVLAVQVAVGEGGRMTDGEGALSSVAEQPFGAALLALLSIGLVGFVVWRFVQTFVDPEHKGTRPKGLLVRAMYAVSGLVYAGLCLSALQLLVGRARGGGRSTQGWTARLLEQPYGQVLVALVGLVILGYAVQQLRVAWKRSFTRRLDFSRLRGLSQAWAVRISRFGLAARALVFLTIGTFFVRAAVDANAREAKGVGEALSTLSRQPEGELLLGAVALGLIAYAVYLFIVARCRRIVTSGA